VLHLTLNRPGCATRCRWRWCSSCARRWPRPRPTAAPACPRAARRRRPLLRRRRPADMAAARMKLADDPDALVKVNEAFGDLCVAFAQHRPGHRGRARRHGDGRRLRPGLRGRRGAGRRQRGVPPAGDLAGRGAGADRALPGRAAGLRRGQAAGRHRRPARRQPRWRCGLVHEVHAGRGAAGRAGARCWARSCNARPAPSRRPRR
jgi:hypothetical protein